MSLYFRQSLRPQENQLKPWTPAHDRGDVSVATRLETTDFSASPERKPKNKLKTLREKELRDWLRHHNPKMFEETDEQFRHEQIHNHLIDGVSLSADPEKHFNNNLMFVAPIKNERSKARGKKNIDEVHRTARFPNAIQTLQKYDKDKRWEKGLNATTLMTEYRRKVILSAFGYAAEGVEEDREHSQQKVKLFMQENWEDLLDEQDRNDPNARAHIDTLNAAEGGGGVGKFDLSNNYPKGKRKKERKERELIEDFSTTGKYLNFINNSNSRIEKGYGCTKKQVPTFKQKIKDPHCNFQPKESDYDIMRMRWRYLKPEMTALLSRKSMAPESISRQVHSDVSNSIVTGSFRDVLGYEDIHTKTSSRKISVATPRPPRSFLSLSEKFSMSSTSVTAGPSGRLNGEPSGSIPGELGTVSSVNSGSSGRSRPNSPPVVKYIEHHDLRRPGT